MSIGYSPAEFKSYCLTLRVTTTTCSISRSQYANANSDFQNIIDKIGIAVVDQNISDGIPVDLCYYWWEYPNGTVDEVIQRDNVLRNFNQGINAISGTWLLNQDRFLKPVSTLDKIPHPLIHIPSQDASSEEFLLKYFPRYAFIMDESIWNYLLLGKRDVDKQEQFKKILDEIRKYAFEKKYYYLNIAQEYAHLNARIAREAFILNNGGNSNHGAHISPFLFHSEAKLMEKINTKEIEKYNWRFLLLDDKIDENKESGRLSSSDPSIILTKPQIIKERIDEMGLSCSVVLAEGKKNELPTIQGNEKIQIVCVDTIDRAIELMKQYKFDIVLLDYLLEDSFGYELLKLLKEGDTRTKDVLVGPQNKNFFMFISAFTTAVNERLALEGLSRDESFWSIGEGACPTSTPALFKYRLAHLMGRRLEQTGINYLSEDYIFETILKIFKDSSTNNSSERIPVVRKRAYEAYRNVLGMHYDYSMLKKDQSSSVLVDSFMKNKVHMGSMLEHLLQLVHLTAFGTVRQWPEIWEEYKFFTRSIDGVDDQKIKSLSESIEDYIIVLKSV